MTTYSQIFEDDSRWIESKKAEQPDFFDLPAIVQKPDYSTDLNVMTVM